MRMTWKKQDKSNKRPIHPNPNLPFDYEDTEENKNSNQVTQKEAASAAAAAELLAEGVGNGAVQHITVSSNADETIKLAEGFLAQGNKLAEDGKYGEALGKWETAITLMPERAVLHEQKAQVLLEIGEAWNALKAATCATELEPLWAEAWITLGRAQLNFGEPDSAIGSFDKALAIKPDSLEAQDDRQTALQLVRKRKQLRVISCECYEGSLCCWRQV